MKFVIDLNKAKKVHEAQTGFAFGTADKPKPQTKTKHRGGPFIGPRGGKWADPQHTIPWKEDQPEKPKVLVVRRDKKTGKEEEIKPGQKKKSGWEGMTGREKMAHLQERVAKVEGDLKFDGAHYILKTVTETTKHKTLDEVKKEVEIEEREYARDKKLEEQRKPDQEAEAKIKEIRSKLFDLEYVLAIYIKNPRKRLDAEATHKKINELIDEVKALGGPDLPRPESLPEKKPAESWREQFAVEDEKKTRAKPKPEPKIEEPLPKITTSGAKYVDYGSIPGARKDLGKMTREDMDKNPMLAAKLVTKANVFGTWKPAWAEADREAGVSARAAYMKRDVLEAVANKPGDNNALRHYYREGAARLLDGLARCYTEDDVQEFLSEWEAASKGMRAEGDSFVPGRVTVNRPSSTVVSSQEIPTQWGSRREDTRAYRVVIDGETVELTRYSSPALLYAARETFHNFPADRAEFERSLGIKGWSYGADGKMRMLVAGDPDKELYGQYTIAFGKRFANLVNMDVRKRRGKPGLYAVQKYVQGSSWRTEDTQHPERVKFGQRVDSVVKHKDDWGWATKKKEKKAPKKMEVKAVEKTDSKWVWVRSTGEVKRVGGKKVTAPKDSSEFAKSFGMSAVQYGNWANEAERQWHVENAYEALHDLADVIGIDPGLLAMNNRLKLSFGARGTGGKKAPAAHYEPQRGVINLTKLRGAGSLAHEFGHFMDHAILLAYQPPTSGKAKLLTESVGTVGSVVPKDVLDAMRNVMDTIKYEHEAEDQRRARLDEVYKQRAAIRDELDELKIKIRKTEPRWDYEYQRAVTAVYRERKGIKMEVAMDRPPPGGWKEEDKVPGPDTSKVKDADVARYAEYSEAVDRHNKLVGQYNNIRLSSRKETQHYAEAQAIGGSYYSKDVEMFARAFESYVEDRLHEQGRANTYLVAGTREQHISGGASLKVKKPELGIFVAPDTPHRKRCNEAIAGLLSVLRKNDQFRKSLAMGRSQWGAWLDDMLKANEPKLVVPR